MLGEWRASLVCVLVRRLWPQTTLYVARRLRRQRKGAKSNSLTSELRNIELIVGERINLDDVDEQERDTLAKIQEILYQTEEGFEVPDGEEGELLEDETF